MRNFGYSISTFSTHHLPAGTISALEVKEHQKSSKVGDSQAWSCQVSQVLLQSCLPDGYIFGKWSWHNWDANLVNIEDSSSFTFFPKAAAKGSFEKSTVIKDCWSDGCLERVSSKTAERTREKTAENDGCLQRLEKRLENRLQKRLQMKILLSLKIYSLSVLGAGIAPVDLTTLSSLRVCWTLKTMVKCRFFLVRATLSSLRACRTFKLW